MSLDAIPYIGKYSGRTPDLYVTTGFNKCGGCPCHGSRFEKDGPLIDNPATGDADITYKKGL